MTDQLSQLGVTPHSRALQTHRPAAQSARLASLLVRAVVTLASFSLTVLYAQNKFVPQLLSFYFDDTYDAFRYHHEATLLSRMSVTEILTTRLPFASYYFHFLAIVYRVCGSSALIGCVVNWVLWTAAGLLLLAPVRDASHDSVHENSRTRITIFWLVWMLLPEAVDWCGTTSKEPICVLVLVVGLRFCLAIAHTRRLVRVAMLSAAAITTGWLAYLLRGAAVPFLGAAFAAALEVRFSPKRWTLRVATLTVGVVGLLGGYAASSFLDDIADNPLGEAGYARQLHFASGLSSNSVLRTIGSPNRVIDAFAVPVRGAAHMITPLVVAPWKLPFAEVAQTSDLVWASALIYSLFLAPVLLGVWESLYRRRKLTTPSFVFANAWIVALLVLGLSGIIHERYRSLFVAAYIPLGIRELSREHSRFGWGRVLLFLGAVLIVGFTVYVTLKFGSGPSPALDAP